MTAKEFKEGYERRHVCYRYDEDVQSILNRYVIDGIYQCLVNQEKIMEMLKK